MAKYLLVTITLCDTIKKILSAATEPNVKFVISQCVHETNWRVDSYFIRDFSLNLYDSYYRIVTCPKRASFEFNHHIQLSKLETCLSSKSR